MRARAVYALLTPSDTRPVKQFIKPTNCPVVGMHFIFIRTHPTHQPMLYSLYSWYSWYSYSEQLGRGGASCKSHREIIYWQSSCNTIIMKWIQETWPAPVSGHLNQVLTNVSCPAGFMGLLSQAKTKILADNCKWILLHAVQCGGGCVYPAVCSSGSLESGHNLTFLQISEEALWPTRT